jgi:hypothetical protein
MHKSWIGITVIAVVDFVVGPNTQYLFLLHPAQSRKKKGKSQASNLNVKEIRQKDMVRQQKRCRWEYIFSSSQRLSGNRRVARQCWRRHPVGRVRGSE